MEIDRLLNELEDLVEAGSSVPWFGRRYISEEDFHRLINAVRHELPRSISEAAEIVAQRDRMLSRAQEQAREILDQASKKASEEIEDARARVEEMLSRESVVQKAEQRAEEILRAAEQEAASIRAETQMWVAGLFTRLDNEMTRIAGTIAHSRSALESQLNQAVRASVANGGTPATGSGSV